jgi:hypothetical protein
LISFKVLLLQQGHSSRSIPKRSSIRICKGTFNVLLGTFRR